MVKKISYSRTKTKTKRKKSGWNFLRWLFLGIIAAAIPATILLTGEPQDIRQRAQVITTQQDPLSNPSGPSIQIVQPLDGAKLPLEKETEFVVTASDPDGISEIKIYADGDTMNVCTNETLCRFWWTAPKGAHRIKAVAVDRATPPNANETTITVIR